MRGRIAALMAASVVAGGAVASVATAAAGPPPPETFGGAKVSAFPAAGLLNPTSFAWGDGAMFAGDSGASTAKVPNGGLYVIKSGVATKISPPTVLFVGGVAWHGGALYASDVAIVGKAPAIQITKWTGWNGSTFASEKVIYTAPKKSQGLNGIAFGANGRLYVGVDAGLLNGNDHGPASLSPDLYDILSMSATGKDLKVVASGIRQPWQMAFAPGSNDPFASDLGQDGPKSVKNPPDFLLKITPGQNYGFPKCNWTKATLATCKKYAKPYKMFDPHFDPMGLAIVGSKLYIGSFLGPNSAGGGALYSMPLKGGKVSPVVMGLPAATDALAAHDGDLYVGGSTRTGTGVVFLVKP